MSQQSKLQKYITLSIIEEEYIATVEAYNEALWLKKFLKESSWKQEKYVVYYDIQSVNHFSKNPKLHSKSKLSNARYHWTRDVSGIKLLHLMKIHTNKNVLDIDG